MSLYLPNDREHSEQFVLMRIGNSFIDFIASVVLLGKNMKK
jgi:hypothetical protein